MKYIVSSSRLREIDVRDVLRNQDDRVLRFVIRSDYPHHLDGMIQIRGTRTNFLNGVANLKHTYTVKTIVVFVVQQV